MDGRGDDASTGVATDVLQVGDKSWKDFYNGFRRLTGMTPNTFRGVPPDRARDVIERARLALIAAGTRPVETSPVCPIATALLS